MQKANYQKFVSTNYEAAHNLLVAFSFRNEIYTRGTLITEPTSKSREQQHHHMRILGLIYSFAEEPDTFPLEYLPKL